MAAMTGLSAYVDIVLAHACGHSARHRVGREHRVRAEEILAQLDCERCGHVALSRRRATPAAPAVSAARRAFVPGPAPLVVGAGR